MAVESAVGLIEQLPQRFIGDGSHSEGRYRIRVGRAIRDVVIAGGACSVGKPKGDADAEIKTDHDTWREIDSGRLSGIEAFGRRTLSVRGSIERSLHFEPQFFRPDRGGLRYKISDVEVGGATISTLMAGDPKAEPLILLHGLGATKASWLTVVPQLARRYRVLAIDLPGFGRSSKPWGRYDSAWFAGHVFKFMDRLGYESALVGGNSMGGKIAMEMAMLEPRRVRAIACLCPASAFTRRPMLRVVRTLRPEMGLLVGRLPRNRLRKDIKALFAAPDRLEDVWYEAAIDDFCRVWRQIGARKAFLSAARHIYLEEPHGEDGFFTRLGLMKPPALYIYGEKDALISHHFGRKMQATLPDSQVLVWPDCGHVPQIEWPDRTATAMIDFFAASAAERAAS